MMTTLSLVDAVRFQRDGCDVVMRFRLPSEAAARVLFEDVVEGVACGQSSVSLTVGDETLSVTKMYSEEIQESLRRTWSMGSK